MSASICTTDDPTDSLEHHAALNADPSFTCTVAPTFRPDPGMAFEQPALVNAWIGKLGISAGMTIDGWRGFIAALQARHDFFHENGCRVSDHGIEVPYAEECSEQDAERIFTSVRAGAAPSPADCRALKSAVMLELGRMDGRAGWVQQLHMGAMRDVNTRFLRGGHRLAGCARETQCRARKRVFHITQSRPCEAAGPNGPCVMRPNSSRVAAAQRTAVRGESTHGANRREYRLGILLGALLRIRHLDAVIGRPLQPFSWKKSWRACERSDEAPPAVDCEVPRRIPSFEIQAFARAGCSKAIPGWGQGVSARRCTWNRVGVAAPHGIEGVGRVVGRADHADVARCPHQQRAGACSHPRAGVGESGVEDLLRRSRAQQAVMPKNELQENMVKGIADGGGNGCRPGDELLAVGGIARHTRSLAASAAWPATCSGLQQAMRRWDWRTVDSPQYRLPAGGSGSQIWADPPRVLQW